MMLFKFLFWLVSWALVLWFVIRRGYKDGVKIRGEALKQAKEEFISELREADLNK